MKINMKDSGYVEGINLWRVAECQETLSKNSTPMLEIKLRTGSSEIVDRAMLAGGGWKFGRLKLKALGVPEDFVGDFPVDSMRGKLLWVATVVKPNTYIDKNGETVTKDRLEVDVNQLKYAGLQPANDPPPGFTAPPADVDETPF